MHEHVTSQLTTRLKACELNLTRAPRRSEYRWSVIARAGTTNARARRKPTDNQSKDLRSLEPRGSGGAKEEEEWERGVEEDI